MLNLLAEKGSTCCDVDSSHEWADTRDKSFSPSACLFSPAIERNKQRNKSRNSVRRHSHTTDRGGAHGNFVNTVCYCTSRASLRCRIFPNEMSCMDVSKVLELNRTRCTKLAFLIKLRGLSPRTNCTDRATAASRRTWCQLLLIEGVAWSAWRIHTAVFSAL
jgi:hypothetical protein